jgi:hypothetical protein
MNLLMNRAAEHVRYPAAVIMGIAGATLLCLWGSFAYYQFESAYQQQYPDPYQISAQFVRLAPVQAVVPQNAVLGYLTDAPPGSIVDSALLAGAEYALAPRLVIRDTAHEWVLGNFTRQADFGAVGKSAGLRLQRDFGNGVVLYGRESQP